MELERAIDVLVDEGYIVVDVDDDVEELKEAVERIIEALAWQMFGPRRGMPEWLRQYLRERNVRSRKDLEEAIVDLELPSIIMGDWIVLKESDNVLLFLWWDYFMVACWQLDLKRWRK